MKPNETPETAKQDKPAANKKPSAAKAEAKPAPKSVATVVENKQPSTTLKPSEKEQKTVKVKQPYVRANNDPRVNAQPVTNLVISSETLNSFVGQSLNTALPADIDHRPRQLTRPANDPRVAKAAVNEPSHQGQASITAE